MPTYIEQLQESIADARTTPEHVVLQFSTAAPLWRSITPHRIRQRGDMNLWATLFNKNWASPLIRRLCHSPFSHVDFVLPDGNLLGASNQGVGTPCIEGNPCGVAVRPPDYQDFGIRRNMIIKTDKAQFILAAAYAELGKPFDNDALWRFIGEGAFTRDWRDPAMWFCAELVPHCFERGAYWYPEELIWPKDRFSPTDLILLFQMDPNFINRKTFWDELKEQRTEELKT
jgi:hypothetical protein